jgi:hypothetical protein
MTPEATAVAATFIQTSDTSAAAAELHAHAEVVSAFLANGMSEMMKNHPVPPR